MLKIFRRIVQWFKNLFKKKSSNKAPNHGAQRTDDEVIEETIITPKINSLKYDVQL